MIMWNLRAWGLDGLDGLDGRARRGRAGAKQENQGHNTRLARHPTFSFGPIRTKRLVRHLSDSARCQARRRTRLRCQPSLRDPPSKNHRATKGIRLQQFRLARTTRVNSRAPAFSRTRPCKTAAIARESRRPGRRREEPILLSLRPHARRGGPRSPKRSFVVVRVARGCW